MARKPARLERAGALTPRDRMWAAIRALGPSPVCTFSISEVHYLANLRSPLPEPIHVDSVDSYFRGLAAAEPPYLKPAYLVNEVPGRRRSELQLYALIRDVGIEAPRVTKDGKPVTQGLGNELMWGAMKVLKDFDHAELVGAIAEAAAKAGTSVSEETAKSYCTALCRAGYLVLVSPNRGPHAKARYRFVRARNTGPRAPLITKDKTVMDANTGEVVFEQSKGGKECQART